MEGFELILAYLDKNSLCYRPPDKELYTEVHKLDEELRKTKYALWMARAEICNIHHHLTFSKKKKEKYAEAERKCLEKAKEFE